MNSRAFIRYLPSLLLAVATIVAWMRLRADAGRLQALIDLPRSVVPLAAAPTALPKESDKRAALEEKLAEIEARAAAGELALQEQITANSELEAKIPLEPDELVASFGQIADMGRVTGEFMGVMSYSFVPPFNTSEKFDEERAINQMLQTLNWASDIGEMERNAEDIATFHSCGIGELFQLDEEEISSLQPILAHHFAEIAAGALTAADQPAKDDGGYKYWKEGRSEALQKLLLDLRPALPKSMSLAKKRSLVAVLNVAAVVSQEKGQLYIRPWPEVPW